MSRTLLSLAGFQVIISGRFWVIAEARKFSANSHKATAFSSRPRRRNYRLLTENSALSNKSAIPVISKSAWTQAVTFDLTSASIRT
jgi:hypothetical protein